MELELLDNFKQDLKHDCMWGGQCDCRPRHEMLRSARNNGVETLLSKSPIFPSDFNEMLLLNSFYGNGSNSATADSLDLLSSFDSDELDLPIENSSNNQLNSHCNNHHNNFANNNASMPIPVPINCHPMSTSNIRSSYASHTPVIGGSGSCSAGFLNDLLLSSSSGNVTLAPSNYGNNMNSSNVSSSNINAVNIASSFEQHLLNAGCSGLIGDCNPFSYSETMVGDPCSSSASHSSGMHSSNASECGSSLLLERTDYDTDDIEDDLDLLEDIIEEEYDDRLMIGGYRSASADTILTCASSSGDNSDGSCGDDQNGCSSGGSSCGYASGSAMDSDVELLPSPISDSLINDHSYGALEPFGLPMVGAKCTVMDSSNNSPMSVSHSSRSTNSRKNSNNRNNNTNNSTHTSLSRRTIASQSQMKASAKLAAANKMKKVMDTDRRKEHNESERMRRDVLKNAFLLLRNKCPKLQSSAKKSSRIQILNEATTYITQINEKSMLLEKLKQQEMQRKVALMQRLRLLGDH